LMQGIDNKLLISVNLILNLNTSINSLVLFSIKNYLGII